MKVTMIAALIALVSISYAQSPAQSPERRGAGHGMGHGRAGGPDRLGMMEMLELDSATTAKIAKLRDENQKDRIALRAKLATARVEFRAAMRKEPADEKAALAKRKEMASFREQLEVSALEHRFAVAKLLTPEQRKLLKKHGGGRRAMMDDGYGERRKKHGRGERHPWTERDDD